MDQRRKIESAIVTGGTAVIGANLVRRLLKENIAVTALVRSASPNLRNLPHEDPMLRLSFGDLHSIFDAELPPADVWFHLGWDGTYGEARNDEARQMKNVDYTENALQKAADMGCKTFVFSSSQAAYGPKEVRLREDLSHCPVTAYGKAKLAAMEAGNRRAEELGIDFITGEVLSVYGPFDHPYTMVMSTVEALLSGACPTFTKGEQLWQYLYADDAAEAFFRLALYGKAGEHYLVSGQEERPLRDYIEMIRDAVDPALPLGIGERPYPPGQVMNLTADISKIGKDTGFMPGVGFRKGIKETVAFAKKRKTVQ